MATSNDAGLVHFEASKTEWRAMDASRSMDPSAGVTLVTDTGTILGAAEDAEDEDQPMQDQEMLDEDQPMQDQEMLDEDCPERKLYKGSHEMGPTTLNCLIYKVEKSDQEMWDTLCLLKNIRHPAIGTIQTFHEDSGEAMVVLSELDGMLRDLVESAEGRHMFFTEKKSVSDLSRWLRSTVIDICSGLQHLFEQRVYPQDITLDDLYYWKDGPVRKHVKLLILKAKKIRGLKEEQKKIELWNQVKLIIGEIHTITKSDVLSKVAHRFVNCIGKDVKILQDYPDLWSSAQKGRYLLSIISANRVSVSASLKNSGLKWAVDKRTHKLPHVLRRLIDYDFKRPKPSGYLLTRPYDYLRLCRTVYKHFPTLWKEVPELKDICQTPEDFIEKMEIWEPEIWCILYDAIGVLKS